MKNICIEMFGNVRLIIDDIFVVTAPVRRQCCCKFRHVLEARQLEVVPVR